MNESLANTDKSSQVNTQKESDEVIYERSRDGKFNESSSKLLSEHIRKDSSVTINNLSDLTFTKSES